MTDAFDVEAYLEQVTQKKEEKNNRDDRRSSRDRERDRDRDRDSDRRRRRSVSRSRSTDRRDRDRDRDSRDRRRRRDSRSRKGRSRSRSRSLGRKRERERERDADDDKSKREKSAERKRQKDEEVVKDREEEKKKREIDDLTKDQRTIFVSQLTKKVSERDLEKFFGQLGKVKSVIMLRDKFTGAHKGFAYVEMDDLETIPNCLLFHNVVPDFQKFPILVKASEAEKNFLAKKDPFNIKNSSSLKEGPDSRIYLGNINVTLDESALQVVLEQFGPVESIKLHRDHLGNSKGFAFVKFEKHDSASLALQTLAGFELAGRPLKVGPVIDAKAALDPSAVGPTGFVDPTSNANWKLDADEGNSGVSLNSQSRMMLMAKLGQAAGIEVPIATVPQTQTISAPITQSNAISGIPSRTILVKNMFDPATETEPNWSQDIREDVSEECSNFGQLDTVYVEAVKPGGLVYIKMKSVEGATKAAISLNGRFFAGRQISVMYIEESVFQTAISS